MYYSEESIALHLAMQKLKRERGEKGMSIDDVLRFKSLYSDILYELKTRLTNKEELR